LGDHSPIAETNSDDKTGDNAQKEFIAYVVPLNGCMDGRDCETTNSKEREEYPPLEFGERLFDYST
jgi:hypothetical protein